MTWHHTLPYKKLKSWYRQLRRQLFRQSRPGGRYLVVDAPPEDIATVLGERHYSPNWELSYYKRGEDLNLARVEWHYDDALPEYQWWQVHVRGWDHGGSTWLKAHWELEPSEHSKPHLRGVGYHRGAGLLALEQTLREANVRYQVQEYDR